jgi:HAD superfamily hydrolase (TIGR01509 family)
MSFTVERLLYYEDTMNGQWVIFDLDGTLIESEQIWRDVRRDFVIQHGGRWHDGAQATMIGMRTAEWAQYIHDDLGVPLEPKTIVEDVVRGVIARLSGGIPVLPGAEAALERLSGAFTVGLATSANLAVAKTVLAKTGWDKLFAAVVSADEVARGKPAPDVYLRAVELLNANASRTAAVEDSANGIRSAHAAHLAVVAIPNHEFPPDGDALSLASCRLRTLGELDVDTIRGILAGSTSS